MPSKSCVAYIVYSERVRLGDMLVISGNPVAPVAFGKCGCRVIGLACLVVSQFDMTHAIRVSLADGRVRLINFKLCAFQ